MTPSLLKILRLHQRMGAVSTERAAERAKEHFGKFGLVAELELKGTPLMTVLEGRIEMVSTGFGGQFRMSNVKDQGRFTPEQHQLEQRWDIAAAAKFYAALAKALASPDFRKILFPDD